ncbi:MAG: DUF4175 family protein [bacterium]
MADITTPAGLVQRLKGILVRQRLIMFLSGLLLCLAALAAAAIGLAGLAALIIVPVWLKLTLLGTLSAGLIVLLIMSAVRYLWRGQIDDMAVRLELKYPEFKGRLIAAIQFVRMERTPGYSAELMAETQAQALRGVGSIDFSQALSVRPLARPGRWLAISATVVIALAILLPGLTRHSWNVYSHPTVEIAPPLGYSLVANPGSTQWVKYRDINIGATMIGDQFPDQARIYHRAAGGSWQEQTVDLGGLTVHTSELGDSLDFGVTLRQVARSFDYYVEAGRTKTPIQSVDVVDRPRVTGIKLSIFYPNYTGLPPLEIDENNGSFSAIVGSRANLAVTTNLPVAQAGLVMDESEPVPMEVAGSQASSALSIMQSQDYYIKLIDHMGEENPDPIQYHITAVPDEYPAIDVLSPGFDLNLGDNLVLPMKVRIYDDFGFSSLALKYQVYSGGRQSEEHVTMLKYSDRIKTEGEVEFPWDVGQYVLYPGEFVTYYFEVADNDAVSGAKTARSRQYVARIPSLDEIVAQADAQSQQRISRSQDLLKQGRDAAQSMKNLVRKLKAQQQQPQAEWQHEKELAKIAEKNAEMVQDLEKMAQQMEKSVDQLAQQSQMSRQLLEKMAQIQKLFEDVATPEMKEAQRKLMEALSKMDPKELQQAMNDFQMSLDEMLQRLERTLALLKRLQLEQKMEAMLQKIEQLAERQEALNIQNDSTAKDNLPSLSPKEDQVKADLEGLKSELEELKKLASEAEAAEVPQFQEFAKQLKTTDADQNMQAMSDQLRKKDRSQASQQGEQALSKLLQMLDQMRQQLADMTSDSNEEMERAMRMAIDDANYLSQSEEDILNDASAMESSSMALRDMATKQQDLQAACAGLGNRISELAKQSPFIAAELDRLLGISTAAMAAAGKEFADKRRNQGITMQREAMANLNLASLRLMESLQQQSNCNKGGSCDKPMQKLQSMCNKQNQLNQKTQQCQNPSSSCNNPGGDNMRMSEDGTQAIQRLAGEQGTIRKSLEDLAAEFGDSRQVLGRLDDIAAEMKEVEEDLAAGQVGQETVNRQLKIFSRMMQASRSLQRRDFTDQRQANTATQELFSAPPALMRNMLEDGLTIEDRLRLYLSEEYPLQYEQQIKAYFKVLYQIQTPSGDPVPEVTPQP